MSPTLEKLRDDILALPSRERNMLIAAVGGRPAFEPLPLDPMWQTELERRMKAFHDGSGQLISEEDMNRELEEMVERS